MIPGHLAGSFSNSLGSTKMKVPDLPPNEAQRLDALKRYQILDTDTEQDLQDVVNLASAICQTPISLISLIDENRQWFKEHHGLDASETSRAFSFCAHGLTSSDLLIVENALEDERFSDNPLVISKPNIRFYAGAPLVTPDGYTLGSLCVIDDQPRKLTDHQLRALKTLAKQVVKHFELSLHNRRLRQLTDLQNRFLSILSHDMKDPLVGLDELLVMLADGSLSAGEFQDIAAEASSQVKLAINLLYDMLEWTAHTQAGAALDTTSIRLRELVEDCIQLASPMAARKQIALLQSVPTDFVIQGNEDMLKFIIRNFMTNAIKFTSDGKIEVSAEDQGGFWRISVTDTGTGMSSNQIAKLHEPGVRYTSVGTNQEKGSGMGLTLCREFVARMGGELSIDSTPREGSTFSFTVAKHA